MTNDRSLYYSPQPFKSKCTVNDTPLEQCSPLVTPVFVSLSYNTVVYWYRLAFGRLRRGVACRRAGFIVTRSTGSIHENDNLPLTNEREVRSLP